MTRKERKLYHKPEVKRVKLVPGEAVLSGCKISGTNGPGQTNNSCTSGAPLDCINIAT